MNLKPISLAALLFAAIFVSAAVTTGQQDSSAPAASAVEKTESVEEVEVLEEVTPGEATHSGGGLLAPVGRFHPLVMHFPIAWLILLAMTETVALVSGNALCSRCAKVLTVLALLSFVPAVATGLILAKAHASDPEFMKLGAWHRNLNISSGIVLLAALVVRFRMSEESTGGRRLPYFMLVLAATGLLVVGSHLGGMMVWGEEFLPLPF